MQAHFNYNSKYLLYNTVASYSNIGCAKKVLFYYTLDLYLGQAKFYIVANHLKLLYKVFVKSFIILIEIGKRPKLDICSFSIHSDTGFVFKE